MTLTVSLGDLMAVCNLRSEALSEGLIWKYTVGPSGGGRRDLKSNGLVLWGRWSGEAIPDGVGVVFEGEPAVFGARS